MPTEGEIVVHDLLRGEVSFEAAQIDDQVLVKSDGYPTYHLANVVDDHLMEITHVIRAEEWISSLPKHVQLYRGFGWEPPVFCHLPLLRNADKSKISKRKNPVSLNYYRRAGFLPEAMLNYLALMGWAMPDEREEFSLDEFVEAFRAGKTSASADRSSISTKLTWLNGKHIRDLATERASRAVAARICSATTTCSRSCRWPTSASRPWPTSSPTPISSSSAMSTTTTTAKAKMVMRDRTPPQTAKIFRRLVEEALDPILDWSAESLEEALRGFCEGNDLKPKELFMPLRIAVTGRTATPPLFDTMAVLGKEICRRRLRSAIEVLRTMKA